MYCLPKQLAQVVAVYPGCVQLRRGPARGQHRMSAPAIEEEKGGSKAADRRPPPSLLLSVSLFAWVSSFFF